MTPVEILAVAAAGLAAGAMNAAVGSGSLITFPALLAVGLPPVTANISNTIGLVLASVGGAWGYRRELAGQRRRAVALGAASVLGGVVGGALLLLLPETVFGTVVPVLIGLAVVLVLVQPVVARRLARRRAPGTDGRGEAGGPVVRGAVFATGIYGGYFGASQGIILLGVLGLTEELHRANALKNVLVGLVNATAAVLFVALWAVGRAPVSWAAAAAVAAGALVGGTLGGRYARRIPAPVLRTLVVVIGVLAIVSLAR